MRIPKKAKRVFNGKFIDVYSWREKMYDGSTGHFEGVNYGNGTMVIPVVGNKIYLTRERQPGMKWTYGTFGGRIENETPLAAAKRELLEEAGLKAKRWKLVKVFGGIGRIDYKGYFYVALDCEFVAKPHLDSGEDIKLVECDWKKFREIVTDEHFRSISLSNYVLRLAYLRELGNFKKLLFGK